MLANQSDEKGCLSFNHRLVFCDPFFATVAKSYWCQIFISVKWLVMDCVLPGAKILYFGTGCQILTGHMRAISQPLPKCKKCFITLNIFATVAIKFGTQFFLIFRKKKSRNPKEWGATSHLCICIGLTSNNCYPALANQSGAFSLNPMEYYYLTGIIVLSRLGPGYALRKVTFGE